MGASHSQEATTGRDIAPHEATICEQHIADLESFRSPDRRDPLQAPAPHGRAAIRSESLEIALLRAAASLRYNAKWFAPAPLSELLEVALHVAGISTSSAAIYATLTLLDTVSTFAFIPADCLFSTAQFLAQASYRTSRAHKTKKVAEFTWTVTVNLLKSHLGPQLDDLLIKAIGGGTVSKDEYAITAGSLMLVTKRLDYSKYGLNPLNVTEVVLRLRSAAEATTQDDFLAAILRLVKNILEQDTALQQVRDIALWSYVLEIVSTSLKASPDTAVPEILQTLALKISTIEPRLLIRVALLYVQAGLPLTQSLSSEMRLHHCTSDDTPQLPEFVDMLLLCTNATYVSELRVFFDHIVLRHQLETPVQHRDIKAVARTYARHIIEPTMTFQARSMLTRALIKMCRCSMMESRAEFALQPLFDALCTAAGFEVEAAAFLFSIRADVTGAMYFAPTELDGPTSCIESVTFLTTPDLAEWRRAILGVFLDGGTDATTWQVYSYFLRETKNQLGNHTLFTGQIEFIKDLQDTIADKIENGIGTDPPLYTGLGKSHVVARLVQTLAASMSYHRSLTSENVTRIVAVFNATAGSRDYIVSTQCIHALTICCYEVPALMSKYMDAVIDKMSKMVTQRYLAIHVLQFLAGLSRLPELFRNFTPHDYKKIFAVCYSYLQTTREAETISERRRTPNSEQSSAASRNEEALPGYVYALAHHVITFWYMSLKRQDREGLKPYITGCLTYEVNGKETIEDQGMVTVDLMDRVDADEGSDHWYHGDVFAAIDGRLVKRDRLIGMLLVSTKTSLRTGRSLVTVRRPSGTTQRLLQHGQARVTVEDGDEYISVIPDDVDGRTYGAISIPKPSSTLGSTEVITLPEDDTVRRAIESLDRTSALDSHKAGVIYIGEAQTTEDRVFRNISGSSDFKEMVRDLGDLEALKGAKFNSQGLDRAGDTDGQHVIIWRNQVTELVFHVTTMMPNSDDVRENTGRKKRHVGNDHVNIIFNNSGRQMDFTALYNLLPGQLTLVYIVVTPSARTSFMQTRTAHLAPDKADRFYSVQVVSRPDYPNISSAAEEKVVSGASLPGMLRNLALNECIMSLMWAQRGETAEYPSSWRSRLLQLRRLGDRYRGR
ncbi:Tuberous sclerosis 2-like protein [Teratosphaeriaceae sp. CCFEE 6253]|nr:Tuberous sclerosis 2-like protein [Teratosphaeriaceae sp. CCFEE 6253]